MRPHRLLLALTLTLALASAAPATAADWTVDVTPDFSFEPKASKIAVGDTVTWTFTSGSHTTTASTGQPDAWDSTRPGGEFNAQGETYPHTFNTPGRFQYFCVPHADFMKGTIEVGEDAESDTVDAVKTKRKGKSVTVSFTLNEAARVSYALDGPGRKTRTVKRTRLGAGKQRLTLRRLKKGSYRATLTLTDDFDKAVKSRSRFKIRR